MNPALISRSLRPIYDKVRDAGRITDEDAPAEKYTSQPDLEHGINGAIRKPQSANALCRKNGNVATYILNRYINYSNICVLSCQFCAFAARKRDDHAFEMAIPEILATVKSAMEEGITEIHMVGEGFIPRSRRSVVSRFDLAGAFARWTPIPHHRRLHRHRDQAFLGATDFQDDLHPADAGSLGVRPALEFPHRRRRVKIFDAEVRDKICRGKESGEEWLEVHRTWHEMGGAQHLHHALRPHRDARASRGPSPQTV